MKLIGSETHLQVFEDADLKVYSTLPAGTFEVNFSQRQGYSLQKKTDLTAGISVYGDTNDNAEMVLDTFARKDSSTGVILSGTQGMGKTVFARVLVEKAQAKGIPTILVNHAYPNLPEFLSSIDQDIIVLFDEFDKNFIEDSDSSSPDTSSQESLLSMFDGLSTSKKLFVVTCNNDYRLSKYIRNRPGRFHYHFAFTYVTDKVIDEFMLEHVGKGHKDEIANVKILNKQTKLTYDYLNALAFEINVGHHIKDAVKYLNIGNLNSNGKYTFRIELKNDDEGDLSFFDYLDPETNVRESFTGEDDKGNVKAEYQVRFHCTLSDLIISKNGDLVVNPTVYKSPRTVRKSVETDEGTSEYNLAIKQILVIPENDWNGTNTSLII